MFLLVYSKENPVAVYKSILGPLTFIKKPLIVPLLIKTLFYTFQKCLVQFPTDFYLVQILIRVLVIIQPFPQYSPSYK